MSKMKSPSLVSSISNDNKSESSTRSQQQYQNQQRQINPIVFSISMTLHQLISENRTKPNYKDKLKQQSKQIFTSRKLPQISISDYVIRIVKYMKIEESTLILALIYIDRISRKKKIFVNEYNIFRLFFSSVVVATKFNEDKYQSNSYYAKIGGMELEQLNEMEMEFVIGINFDLFVEAKIFDKYESTLICNFRP